jgi:hypothetical protein
MVSSEGSCAAYHNYEYRKTQVLASVSQMSLGV